MCFPTKGENHYSGVKNELAIISAMNETPDAPLNKYFRDKFKVSSVRWEHRGGTRLKEDAVVFLDESGSRKISIKNHKSGTFDWVNSSKSVPQELKKLIRDFKTKHKENVFEEVVPDEVRQELTFVLSNYLDEMSSDDLRGLLGWEYEKQPPYLLVNDVRKKELVLFKKAILKNSFLLNGRGRFVLKKTRAVTSRQLWIHTHDGLEINTNLRIRCVLNNGVNALFSDKGAVPCIKIQQDSVDSFLESVKVKITNSY